jgi:hypothetical protein
MTTSKSIIFYTDNQIDEPIKSKVREYLLEAKLPIYSASLKPIDFGENEVITGFRSYPTLIEQIVSCLSRSPTDYVFFCEHDVLYPKCHFDFTPPRDDIFYYNENTWRWLFGNDDAIRHDRMFSLSVLCANRQLALDHYVSRLKLILDMGWDRLEGREPSWARTMGYEPGTKKKKRGGFSDDDFATWSSRKPVIDIRHPGTFSRPKISLDEFKHPPKWFHKIPIDWIDGWHLRDLWN